LNANFSNLDARLAALETGPKACGYTGQYPSGALDQGYKTLFSACQSQGSCGTAAHDAPQPRYPR
jgi:hypothetical protein